MEKLTKEEILHISNLAKIDINEQELEEYAVSLKTLINEIDKIKSVEVKDNEMMYTGAKNETEMREDVPSDTQEFDRIKTNLPKSMGNFVEVTVMLNE